MAPFPRPPFSSETAFRTVTSTGEISEPQRLPSWYDEKDAKRDESTIEDAEVFLSLVVPAYNEERRLGPMLKEAIGVLNTHYSKDTPTKEGARLRKNAAEQSNGHGPGSAQTGWEILVVSDGSNDKTEAIALDFAKAHPGGSIRVVTLKKNRGKGGAVIHGMRHVRGQYIVFADADGASRFADVTKLVEACEKSHDAKDRVVAVGSRAHLVGSAAVVNRSALRNFLMYSFHLMIWLFTPAATSRIKDTQCGFKMFSRQALPYIVPHMHSEGWIFDVEMLMLAERAGIPMVEVPIGWHEVKGSKLNVVWDSIGMAWSLAVLRAAWALGVYRTHASTYGEPLLPGRTTGLRYKGPPKPY